MNKFKIINGQVSILDVLDKYNIQVNHGFACCPIHQEDTASFKVYEKTNSFHCFGCNASGDVINFVAFMEKTDNNNAAKIINDWFKLGLDKPLTIEQKKELSRQSQLKEKQERQKLAEEKLKSEILKKTIMKIKKGECWLYNKKTLTDNMCVVLKELKRLQFIYDSVAKLPHEYSEYDYTIGSENVFNLIKKNIIEI